MNPITRKMLREVSEDEQARAAYPPRPARCEARVLVTTTVSRYERACYRPAASGSAGGFCWQHDRIATDPEACPDCGEAPMDVGTPCACFRNTDERSATR